ncbi:hypothetical protein Dimus_012008 [Dionaea muscipula]
MNARKLLLNERVEVRQVEEGLCGSWYQGVVVGVSEFRRKVEYDELLCKSGKSKLIESIPVTGTIEGLHRRAYAKSKHRGRIRPPPPLIEQRSTRWRLKFGVCVEALFEDAWWEGVIFDCDDGSRERSVFFPDEDDERRFKVSELRVSRDWDEYSGDWSERGVWMLVKLAEEHKMDVPMCQFIKCVWSHLRVNYGFLKMISEWTCGSYHVWKKYFIEVVCGIAIKSSRRSLGCRSSSRVCAVIKSENRVQRFRHGQADETATKSKCKENLDILYMDKHHVKSINFASFGTGKDQAHKMSYQVTQPKRISIGKGVHNGLRSGGKKRQNLSTNVSPGQHKGASPSISSASAHAFVQNNNVLHPRMRHLKSKKRVRKRIYNATVNSSLLSKKHVEVPGSVQKEDGILDSPCYGYQRLPSLIKENRFEDVANSVQKQRMKRIKRCDSVCFICQYGGDLLPCDHCLSSYHLTCIGFKEVPAGKWFCPCCICGFCGLRNPVGDEVFTEICYQCGNQYHVDCLNKAGLLFSDDNLANKFCSQSCFEIYARLHELLQTSNPTSVEGLTWTLTRSRRNDCNIFHERVHPRVQLSQVLNAFHECFQPIIEPHTGRDLVADVVYNSWSKFRRLDFHGFYLMALLKDEEVTCAATVRIHGLEVAEMPLIATPFKYRRKGMCRLLVHELEKMLIEMGVARLVLPATSQLSETWVSSFDFKEMPTDLMQELLGFPFLIFQGTTLFQKVLSKSNLESHSPRSLQEPDRTKAGINQKRLSDPCAYKRVGVRYSRRRT